MVTVPTTVGTARSAALRLITHTHIHCYNEHYENQLNAH